MKELLLAVLWGDGRDPGLLRIVAILAVVAGVGFVLFSLLGPVLDDPGY